MHRSPATVDPADRCLRAVKFGAVGCFWIGPVLTAWFNGMDKLAPGRATVGGLKTKCQKMSLAGPVRFETISEQKRDEANAPTHFLGNRPTVAQVPGRSWRAIAIKLTIDQLIMAPPLLASYRASLGHETNPIV